MKIIEITASMSRTKQIKQFEPVNYHASCKVELGENESEKEAFDMAREMVVKEVNSFMERIEQAKQEQLNKSQNEPPFLTEKETAKEKKESFKKLIDEDIEKYNPKLHAALNKKKGE